MAGKWTKERREAAAARCRANKPWENATGPKTIEGKVRSSYNALKTGEYSVDFRHARNMLRLNKLFMEEFRLFEVYDFRRKLTLDEILKKNELIRLKQSLWPKVLKNNKMNSFSSALLEGGTPKMGTK